MSIVRDFENPIAFSRITRNPCFCDLTLVLLFLSHICACVHALNVFKALSDFTRLRVLRLLLTQGDKIASEIGVGEFVVFLNGQPYNISKQLKILEQAGLVISRKQGRNVYYSLSKTAECQPFHALIATLPDTQGVFKKDATRYKNSMPQNPTATQKEIQQKEQAQSQNQESDNWQEDHLPSHLL